MLLVYPTAGRHFPRRIVSWGKNNEQDIAIGTPRDRLFFLTSLPQDHSVDRFFWCCQECTAIMCKGKKKKADDRENLPFVSMRNGVDNTFLSALTLIRSFMPLCLHAPIISYVHEDNNNRETTAC